MAQVHGIAGEWARVRGTAMSLWPLFVSLIALGFTAAILVFVHHGIGALLLVAALSAVAYFLYRGERRMESFFKGARGEERVAGILKSLPEAYHLFNDFVAGGCHVDHVVVGPAGVFAIETKFWNGKVTLEEGHILVDGHLPDRSPLAQVLKEARLVKGELAKSGWTGVVTPVLAFASNTFEAKIAESHGAVILNARDLKESFATERVVIPAAELERLVRLMENKV